MAIESIDRGQYQKIGEIIMLSELIHYFTTPTTRVAKKYGYLYASIALEKRFQRCRELWATHLSECRNLILQNKPSSAKSIIIIGSGHLIETPITELLENFAKIILIDIVHPKSVQDLAKKEAKIELKTLDITGFTKSEEEFVPPKVDFDGDYIVSANVLSQLSLEPIRFLKLKSGDKKIKLATKMGQDHLNFLKQFSGRKLLYSDTKRIYKTKDNEVLLEQPSRFVISNVPVSHSWEWTISPLGEESKDYSISMIVNAHLI